MHEITTTRLHHRAYEKGKPRIFCHKTLRTFESTRGSVENDRLRLVPKTFLSVLQYKLRFVTTEYTYELTAKSALRVSFPMNSYC